MVSSYRPSMHTFPLSLRVRDCRFCAPARHLFPPLLKISQTSPGIRWLAFGLYEEQRCWANCPCNYFPRFPTYVVLIHQRHRHTDDMKSQYRAMHYNASRGKNSVTMSVQEASRLKLQSDNERYVREVSAMHIADTTPQMLRDMRVAYVCCASRTW